jgi:hypothetical protein
MATVAPNGSGWAYLERSLPQPGAGELQLDFRMGRSSSDVYADNADGGTLSAQIEALAFRSCTIAP